MSSSLAPPGLPDHEPPMQSQCNTSATAVQYATHRTVRAR